MAQGRSYLPIILPFIFHPLPATPLPRNMHYTLVKHDSSMLILLPVFIALHNYLNHIGQSAGERNACEWKGSLRARGGTHLRLGLRKRRAYKHI